MAKEIIKRAFSNDDSIVVEQIIADARFKYLGDKSIDLYINTSKSYIAKKIENNLFAIKDAIYELEGKTVGEVFINNVKHELLIEELNSKSDIKVINFDSINLDVTNEMSGENDIVDQLFEYETSVLNKSKVVLQMHQSELHKEWREEVNMSIIKNKFSIKRKTLIKRVKELISLKYVPTNNDTKEIIKLLGLN